MLDHPCCFALSLLKSFSPFMREKTKTSWLNPHKTFHFQSTFCCLLADRIYKFLWWNLAFFSVVQSNREKLLCTLSKENNSRTFHVRLFLKCSPAFLFMEIFNSNIWCSKSLQKSPIISSKYFNATSHLYPNQLNQNFKILCKMLNKM